MKILIHNGKIWTGENSFVHCLGFNNDTGEITFTGFLLSGKKFEYDLLIDLKGKVVIPSFFDGHTHLRKGSEMKNEINLKNLSTPNEINEKIKSYLSEHSVKWLTGGYFTESDFKGNFKIDKTFLDEVSLNIPIFLSRIDLHSAIINSKAIELSGLKSKITEFSKDEIIVNDKGEMTGEVKERAMDYMLGIIPKVAPDTLAGYINDEIKYMNSLGITHLTDISLPEDLEAYKILFEKYSPNIFINSSLPFENFKDIQKLKSPFEGFEKYIQFGSFKAFYDGSLSSQSAYFKKNYKNQEHNGLRTEFVNSGEFEKIGLEIDKSGGQLLVHAIGDLAIKEVLDFVENLNAKNGEWDRRFRIEHAQHIDKNDIKRFQTLGVIASVQPAHLYVDEAVAEKYLDDTSTLHSYKQISDDNKSKLVFGTDFPVASENPFETIYEAMSRKTKLHPEGFNMNYALDLINCLQAYTINNSYAAFQENNFGILKKGFQANFIVLNNDIFKAKINEIKDIKVEKTFYKGKLIYEK